MTRVLWAIRVATQRLWALRSPGRRQKFGHRRRRASRSGEHKEDSEELNLQCRNCCVHGSYRDIRTKQNQLGELHFRATYPSVWMFLQRADRGIVPWHLIYQLTLKPHAFLQKNISRTKQNSFFNKAFSSTMIVIYYFYLRLPLFFCINMVIVSYDKVINRLVCFSKESKAKQQRWELSSVL